MPGRQSPSVTVDPTDSDLVARLAEGDREALAVLFRRHQAAVYRFSRQMLGSREAAEDVTQEVFVALAKCGQRFDASIGSLTTYLYGIARNLVWRQSDVAARISRSILQTSMSKMRRNRPIRPPHCRRRSRSAISGTRSCGFRCTTEKRSCCASSTVSRTRRPRASSAALSERSDRG